MPAWRCVRGSAEIGLGRDGHAQDESCRLVGPIASGRVDTPLVMHRFKLDRIEEAYDLFAHRRVGVPKVVITS
jgi:threonine dehydrogenase-like Zn-dependent dehydrogenase